MDREILDKQASERDADQDVAAKKREQQAAEDQEREERDNAISAAVHFERVADAVERICSERSGRMPDLELDKFSQAERAALEQLFQAKAAPDTKAIQLSAAVRMKLFNQALAVLYPTLALAKLPKLNFEVEEYEEAADRVAEVREEIKSDVAVEAIFFKVKGVEKKEDEDEEDEGDEDDEDEDDDAEGDGESDEDKTEKKQKKQSRLGRLFRRGKPKDKPADEE